MSERPLKIALVCSTLNQLGGPALHMRQLYTRLSGDGLRMMIILCSAQEDILRDFMLSGGVAERDIILIPHSQKKFLWPFMARLYSIFLKEKFDGVHAFETQTQVLAGLAAYAAGIKNVLCNCEARFLPSSISLPKRLLFRVLNFFLKGRFSRSLTVSQALANELIQQGLRPSIKVEVLHPGIILPEVITPIPFDGRSPVIGMVTRLSPEKGVDRFIRASVQVAREIPRAHFMVFGDGLEEKTLKALVKELSLEECFEFRPWVKDVPAALQELDIFVMPSLREGLPFSLLEAISMGRPVVASDIDGIREVIDTGVNGVLVDTSDAALFSKALISLCADPKRALDMARKALEKAHSCFSVDKEMQRMRQIYREVFFQKAAA